ncbi:unnamed protein product [Nyctereutes procyonoides]|uniref:(raccoon dog) hypothetical protein n=1 Tax=Nyctereutes procyonoides TaxID=34880 RepID=A0A811XVU0_NYCPR|nr:unnamed protein product [Nyctereutes procyonoides]
MLQLWKLVLLCGLLTGTSASVLGNLGDDLNNVVDKLKPVVEKGLETVDNTLESVLQKLKADWKIIQKSKAWHLAEEKVQEVKNLVNDALSKIVPAKDDTLGLNIINSRILKIKAELTLDGEGLNIRIPVVANVTLALPLIGRVVNLKVSLDLVTSVRLATDAQTGAVTVIVGKCSSDEDSISLTVLDGHNGLIEKAANTVSSFLTKTLSRLIEKDVCPLIHTLLSNLDGNIIQDIIASWENVAKLRVFWASVSSLPSPLFKPTESAWQNDLWLLAYLAQTTKRGAVFLEIVTPHEGGIKEEEDPWKSESLPPKFPQAFYARMFALEVLDRRGEIEGFSSVSSCPSPICPTTQPIQNQLTETQGIRVVPKLTLLTWDPHRYCLQDAESLRSPFHTLWASCHVVCSIFK